MTPPPATGAIPFEVFLSYSNNVARPPQRRQLFAGVGDSDGASSMPPPATPRAAISTTDIHTDRKNVRRTANIEVRY